MAVVSNVRRTREPAIRKGGRNSLPFKVAIVGWIDLLGYGDMIADVDYNPIANQAKKPITRLRAFHRIVAEHSTRNFRTLVLNDGAVAYRDLSMRGSANTVDFFCRAWDLYDAVQSSETRNGFAGARMVVAPGLRAKGSRRAIDYTSGHLDSILRRMADGTISADQAVREAAAIEKYFDVLPQLQANFAFSKAYIAEQSGEKFGLKGPAFYVDNMIFDGAKPDWIDADEPIDWKMPKYRLEATFHPVRGALRPKGSLGEILGFRDGIGVATQIAPEDAVRDAMHASSPD
jgi:hypothetical protein